MLIPLERFYSSPQKLYFDTQEANCDLHKFVRDNRGGLWVLGDDQVLHSENGVDWNNYSLNLKDEGPFSVKSVVLSKRNIFAFVQNRHGLWVYALDEDRTKWRATSRLEFSSLFVVAPANADRLILLASDSSSTVLYRSTDETHSWSRVPLPFQGTPMYLHFSDSNGGICCVWHSNENQSQNFTDSSAVYTSLDLGVDWEHITNLETMALDAATMDRKRTLIGGSNGFLAVIDSSVCRVVKVRQRDDIVAVDWHSGASLAVAESDHKPIRYTLIFSENQRDWVEVPIYLSDRVVGIKLIAQGKFVLCTMEGLYIGNSKYASEYYAIWVLSIFADNSIWDHAESLLRILREARSDAIRRFAALALGTSGSRAQVVHVKQYLSSASSLSRTALMLATAKMGTDERKYLKQSLKLHDSFEKLCITS